MSKYTTQVRWIIQQAAQSPFEPITKQIEIACPKIFNFDFPIWDEAYKPILEKKILMHYFNKEIGFETVGLWKFYLNERLNLIMPYYNKLYVTTVQDYDFLSDTNLTETVTASKNQGENAKYEGNTTQEINSSENTSGTDNSTSSQTGKSLSSELPQATLNGLDYGTESNETENNDTSEFTTNRDVTGNSTQTTGQTSTNTLSRDESENRTTTRKGASGARSMTDLLIAYRDSLINIDKQLIDELSDLFMLIY